jgi:uncharacterized protein YjiS (DUF1127 family)
MISTPAPGNAAETLRRPPASTHSAVAFARAALAAVLSSADRRRQRHALAELEDRLLRDIGLTRHQVRMEVQKPL